MPKFTVRVSVERIYEVDVEADNKTVAAMAVERNWDVAFKIKARPLAESQPLLKEVREA